MNPRRLPSALCAALLCLSLLVRCPVAAGAENPFGARGLRFGYSAALFPDLSLADAQTALTIWTRELARLAGYDLPTQLIVYESLPALVSAVQAEQIDFIALNSLDYLKIRDKVPMELALLGEKGGKPGEEQVLLVHRDSAIREIRQLRGKRLAILRSGSGSIASLWLDTILAKHGLPPGETFFGTTKESGKTQQVILPVFFRQADAGIVSRNAFQTAAELNPQIGKDLLVLESSPLFPIAVTCFRTSMSRARKEEFIRMSLLMIGSPSGRQILTLFKVDNIFRSPIGALDGLAMLLRESEGNRIAQKGKSK